MSLDRQAIEKRDFPISRRGYETLAVDAHLAQLAREVEALQAARAEPSAPAPTPSGPSLASSASEQVRTIVQAAERSAAEIEQQATADADRQRDDAATQARQLRETAEAAAQEHVAAVEGETAAMRERIAALEVLFGQLLSTAEEVQVGLDALRTQVGSLTGSDIADVPPTPAQAAATPAPTTPAAIAAASVPSTEAAPAAATSTAAAPVSVADPAAVGEPPVDPPSARSTDEAGARMVALNLVLDGAPRDQIERHLDAHYVLADRDGLLDDLYARQGQR